MCTKYASGFLAVAVSLLRIAAQARPEALKPFILGEPFAGDVKQVSEIAKTKLTSQGFEIVGAYSPFAGAMVICVTNNELKTAAAKAFNGGFGAAQRVAVTDVKGKIQVAYVNPAYIGTAYGLGKLEGVSAKMKAALGAVKPFGSEDGIEEGN